MLTLTKNLLAAAVCFAFCQGTTATSVAAQTKGVFSAASELSVALDRHVNCLKGEVRVGIWPLDNEALPITESNAHRLYSDVLSELFANKPDCVSLWDGGGVGNVLGHLNRLGGLGQEGMEKRKSLEENLRNVDFLISMSITERSGDARASLTLVDQQHGRTLASTSALSIPKDYLSSTCGDGAVPFESALSRAAHLFVDQAPDMRRLVLGGAYYRDTDTWTGLSRYTNDLLSQAIASKFGSILTGEKLETIDPIRNSSAAIRLRGVKIMPRDLAETVSDPGGPRPTEWAPSTYRLELRTWPCDGDDRVKLVAKLENRNGAMVSWTGSAKLDSLPSGISIHPPKQAPEVEWKKNGDFGFEMTSAHGPNPVLSAGDELQAVFSLEKNAWLHCFYTDSTGETIQVLPNSFQKDTAAANYYSSEVVHVFPSADRDPFKIEISDQTTGIEIFTCVATENDISDQLPVELLGQSFAPIPPHYITRLEEVFRATSGSKMSLAKMSVTVLR